MFIKHVVFTKPNKLVTFDFVSNVFVIDINRYMSNNLPRVDFPLMYDQFEFCPRMHFLKNENVNKIRIVLNLNGLEACCVGSFLIQRLISDTVIAP